MIELKPCPFCGAKAEAVEFTEREETIGWEIHCTWCNAINPHFSAAETEEEAIKAWNTRYEPTCTMEDNGDYTMYCSCGEEIDFYMTEHYGDGTAEYSYTYCPHCGAKVI